MNSFRWPDLSSRVFKELAQHPSEVIYQSEPFCTDAIRDSFYPCSIGHLGETVSYFGVRKVEFWSIRVSMTDELATAIAAARGFSITVKLSAVNVRAIGLQLFGRHIASVSRVQNGNWRYGILSRPLSFG